MQNLDSLKYAELRKLAKKAGVKANLKVRAFEILAGLCFACIILAQLNCHEFSRLVFFSRIWIWMSGRFMAIMLYRRNGEEMENSSTVFAHTVFSAR